MSTKRKLRVGKKPDPAAAISAKEIRASKRLLRHIFGTSTLRHKMAIILPGSDITEVEVHMPTGDDDLVALAEAVGVTPSGGDRS